MVHNASGTPHEAVFWLVKNVFCEMIVYFFIKKECVHIIIYPVECLQCVCDVSFGKGKAGFF